MARDPEPFRIEIHQFAPILGDPLANMAAIADRAGRSDADLLVTPELALTGYDIGDEGADLALPLSTGVALAGSEPLRSATPVVLLGMVERGDDGTPYNALAVLERGVVRHRHRKIYLPTYGMFDEARFFGAGHQLEPWEWRGWTVGLLICEDFWHPGLAYVLASAGIDLLVVAAAPAGRGGWIEDDRDPAGSGRFASAANWDRIAVTTAQMYGIYVALAMRTGVEGGSTFAGGSLIVGPDGVVVQRAPALEAAVIGEDLSADRIAAARRPYSHLRDDDWRLVRRLLDRLDV